MHWLNCCTDWFGLRGLRDSSVPTPGMGRDTCHLPRLLKASSRLGGAEVTFLRQRGQQMWVMQVINCKQGQLRQESKLID